jgi:hypothetical protein
MRREKTISRKTRKKLRGVKEYGAVPEKEDMQEKNKMDRRRRMRRFMGRKR